MDEREHGDHLSPCHRPGADRERAWEIGAGFSVDVARNWERAFFAGDLRRTRRVALRMAIVLGNGPALNKLAMAARFGLGGPQLDGWWFRHRRYRGIGPEPSGPTRWHQHATRGEQKISWIHLDDLLAGLRFIDEHDEIEGPVNLAAPGTSTNRELMAALRRAVRAPLAGSWRPASPSPIPSSNRPWPISSAGVRIADADVVGDGAAAEGSGQPAEVVLVVDVANVMGSRPDGWWRDRAGAASRLIQALEPLVGATVTLPDSRRAVTVTEVRAVVEGAAKDVTGWGTVVVRQAERDGDSAIAGEARGLTAVGETPLVVTADRGLRQRLPERALTVGPGWLNRLLGR